MQEIDAVLDDHPELAIEMVELDSRNRNAHEELQAFNDHKVFVYKHPVTVRRKQYDDQLTELYNLKRTDPGALMTEIANLMQNIRRIQSNLNRKKYKSVDEQVSWDTNLTRSELRMKVLKEVISK
jgi:predicted  nucleic acid-binding Zn-ribbon protein